MERASFGKTLLARYTSCILYKTVDLEVVVMIFGHFETALFLAYRSTEFSSLS